MKKNIPLLLVLAFWLTGCGATVANLDFVPRDIQYATTKYDAELKSINVSMANEQEKTGELMTGVIGNDYEQSFRTAFKDSLEGAVNSSGLFKDDAKRKVNIFAKVLKFSTPTVGINFPSDMDVNYKIQDRENGVYIFDKTLQSHGEVPGNYAFNGLVRFNEARNRCVQQNIRMFVDEVKKAALDQQQSEAAPVGKVGRKSFIK